MWSFLDLPVGSGTSGKSTKLLVVGVWNANTAQPGISLGVPYLSLIIGSRMLPRMPRAGVEVVYEEVADWVKINE